MGIAYPKCAYVIAHANVGPLRSELTKMPGVKVFGTKMIIPHHALTNVHSMLGAIPIASAEWIGEPPLETSWASVEAILRERGETREFVLDGFLMPYQKEALQFSTSRNGVHFWHPTGAGKTLTGILWGLLGNGPLVIITRAASRLQYGREVEKFTNIRPYVVRPKGYVRKNPASGGKPYRYPSHRERMRQSLSLPKSRSPRSAVGSSPTKMAVES